MGMQLVMGFEEKKQSMKHIPGPEGVRGRNSDNALILEKLGWEPTVKLSDGLKITYFWIRDQLQKEGGDVSKYSSSHFVQTTPVSSPRRRSKSLCCVTHAHTH